MVTNGVVSTPPYTPLESLLFFQALRAQDLKKIDFTRISDELVSLPLVRNDAAFDRERLSSDALRSLYLSLVKQEAQEEIDAASKDKRALTNGEPSPSSRKRKAASPSLPTVEAAAKHAHLLPKLLFKLYARYRETVAAEIKEEEQTIDRLDHEIGQIENGELDEQLKADNKKEIASKDQAVDSKAESKSGTETSSAVKETRSTRSRTDIKNAPSSPAKAIAPDVPSAKTTPGLQQGQTPSLAQSSPLSQQVSPRTAQIPLQNTTLNSAHAIPIQPAPSGPPTASPRVVPIAPAGQSLSPSIPQSGFQSPQAQALLQPSPYGSPNQRPVAPAVYPAGRGYSPPQQYQNFQQQYQQYGQPPYVPQQQSQTSQQYQIRPSQQGGFQLPPFQVSAQDPSKVHHQYPNQQGAPQSRNATPVQPRVNQSPYTQPGRIPQTPQTAHRPSLSTDQLTQSVVASLRRRRSTSTWKASPHPPPAEPKSPTRPVAEPISPVQSFASLPDADVKDSDDQQAKDRDAPRTRKSESKRTTRRTRGSSIASSTKTGSVRGRTRSQSVLSQTESVPPSDGATTSRRKVKPEPSTPADHLETETPRPRTTRTRRGTLQPPSAPSTARRSPHSTPRPPEQRSDVVTVTRNFPRLSAVILNEITAHRHAGPFQKPVSNREVEGYRDIIKRPQDLKSIKAAITAGSRAVAAALAATDDSDNNTSSGAVVALPRTEDLIPPRAIVNSAQLEKEVLRMFANAVLFNPGDEGIVQDAREMAEDMAGKINDWRGVEREGNEREDEEDDTAAATAAAAGGGSTKRRKI